ncbi:MAG: tetratricopeptide repeat protein [Candidatus Binatia bacterium]
MLNNLGGLHALQGRFDQAEDLFQRTLRIQEQSLGIDNPQLATAVHNLAWVYHKQRKFKPAKALYLRVIQIWSAEHGIDHPDVALGMNNLDNLERALGNRTAAAKLLGLDRAYFQKLLKSFGINGII